MKNKKKLVIIIAIVVAIAGIITAGVFSIVNWAGNYQKKVYDDNSKIISQADSFSYFNSSRNNKKGILKANFTLTGMDTIYKLRAKESGVIDIDYDLNIKSGKFKLVLIDPDNKVSIILDKTGKGHKTVNIKSGKSRIKFVGNNTTVEAKIKINGEDNINIHYLDE